MENPSIYSVFERMWQHILAKFNSYISTDVFEAHTSNTNNPHGVTKDQVGLGAVDNTSDEEKPISALTQAALDSIQEDLNKKAYTEHTHSSDDIKWSMGTVISMVNGGTGHSTIEDNTYDEPRYRASALLDHEPTLSYDNAINGVIYWVYE